MLLMLPTTFITLCVSVYRSDQMNITSEHHLIIKALPPLNLMDDFIFAVEAVSEMGLNWLLLKLWCADVMSAEIFIRAFAQQNTE